MAKHMPSCCCHKVEGIDLDHKMLRLSPLNNRCNLLQLSQKPVPSPSLRTPDEHGTNGQTRLGSVHFTVTSGAERDRIQLCGIPGMTAEFFVMNLKV
jgi:hypothetical protein